MGLESGGLLDQRGFLHRGWVGHGLHSWGLLGLEGWHLLGLQGRVGSCFRLLDWSLLRLRIGDGLLLGVRIGALVGSRRLWGSHRGTVVFSWLWLGRDCDES